MRQDESWSKWVLCKVYEKKMSQEGASCCYSDDDNESEVSWLDQVFMSLDDDDDLDQTTLH